MSCVPSEFVREYCAVASAESASSLHLLRVIDDIVDWLSGLQKKASGDIECTIRLSEAIKQCEPKKPIDSDDLICNSIEETENNIENILSVMADKRRSALQDAELTGEHEESVVGEYEQAISVYQDLFNAMADFRQAIMEHDAELSPVTGSFRDPKDLVVHLRSL